MSKFQGFSTLATPADLLEKLRHDLSRIRQNLTHPYAAFDFFVTAEHLLDWKYPDTGGQSNKDTRTRLRTTTPLLRVVSHLANGAKHFKATRHESVDSVHTHSGFFAAKFFDPGYFDTDSLRVELMGDDALALGPEITVLALAQQVLQYWEVQLASSWLYHIRWPPTLYQGEIEVRSDDAMAGVSSLKGGGAAVRLPANSDRGGLR